MAKENLNDQDAIFSRRDFDESTVPTWVRKDLELLVQFKNSTNHSQRINYIEKISPEFIEMLEKENLSIENYVEFLSDLSRCELISSYRDSNKSVETLYVYLEAINDLEDNKIPYGNFFIRKFYYEHREEERMLAQAKNILDEGGLTFIEHLSEVEKEKVIDLLKEKLDQPLYSDNESLLISNSINDWKAGVTGSMGTYYEGVEFKVEGLEGVVIFEVHKKGWMLYYDSINID